MEKHKLVVVVGDRILYACLALTPAQLSQLAQVRDRYAATDPGLWLESAPPFAPLPAATLFARLRDLAPSQDQTQQAKTEGDAFGWNLVLGTAADIDQWASRSCYCERVNVSVRAPWLPGRGGFWHGEFLADVADPDMKDLTFRILEDLRSVFPDARVSMDIAKPFQDIDGFIGALLEIQPQNRLTDDPSATTPSILEDGRSRDHDQQSAFVDDLITILRSASPLP